MSLIPSILRRRLESSPPLHLDRCLSLDIEANEADRRINKLAGVRPDTGESVTFDARSEPLDEALGRLDSLGEGASFTLGHNLIRFDLPILRAVRPQMRLLDLPAIAIPKRLSAGHPNVVDVIEDGVVRAVINTVTGDREVLQDGFAIRRAASEARIPCFTSLDTARAAVESMVGSGSEYSVKPLPAYRI